MPATEAQILANRRNAERSTGPKTAEGKERSRANAIKHGLTGEGIALPAEDAAEVDRLQRSFEAELKPSSDFGRTLVRRMALMSVRMDRCVATETATLTARVLQAEADFDAEWPEVEGENDPERERMRVEAARRAMFDPSRESCLARKYEAAAERSFFRSLKELRQVERQVKAGIPAPQAMPAPSKLASSLPEERKPSTVKPPAANPPRQVPSPAPKTVAATPVVPAKPVPAFPISSRTPTADWSEVPITIGRAV